MPQSLAKVHVHLVFSTKNRERVLRDEIRADLHAYMGGILRDLESPAIEINTEPDHAHVLFTLARTHTLSDVVAQLKRGSSAWLKSKGTTYATFHWQNGFGAFSVSQSAVPEVRDYIQRQREHHQRTAFQDEFRAFLHRHEVEFDERYVWD
jgi:REP element-mobilizing transposase RayT